MKWKNNIISAIVSGIVSAIVYALFDFALFELLSSFSLLSLVIGEYWWVILSIIFIVFFILIKHHLSDENKGLAVSSITFRPNYIHSKMDIKKFGVLWKALWGSRVSMGDLYTYVDGPYCPNCTTELGSTQDKRFFGLLTSKIWRCPNCGKKYKRPDEYLYGEEDAVKKIADKKFKRKD